jgi:hypothetical protein
MTLSNNTSGFISSRPRGDMMMRVVWMRILDEDFGLEVRIRTF